MINFDDFTSKKWDFISRNIIRGLTSSTLHFNEKLKRIQNKLTEERPVIDKFDLNERIKNITLWKEQIDVAKSEAEIVFDFASYLKVIDYERSKMKLHIKYVFFENLWLRYEMYDLHRLLILLEKKYLEAEAEKRFFQYYYNMRNYTKISAKKALITLRNDAIEEFDDEDSEPEEDVPPNLSALFNVVTQFISEDRFLVAACWCDKSLIDFKRKYGEISKEVGAVYNLLGRIYKNSEAYKLAKDYFEMSLNIREKIHGKESDQVGITLTLLGSTLGKLENYKMALEICKKALIIREKIYGRNNEIAHLYKKVAEFSFSLKMWNDSISNYKICLNIFDEFYDLTEWAILKSCTTLAHAYLETNVTNKALECLIKVNLAYIKKNNPGSSNTATPISVIEECIKRNVKEFPPEMLLQRFGTISENLDENVVDVMRLYYEKVNRYDIAEMLKGWIDLSLRNMNKTDNSIIVQTQLKRKLSMVSLKSPNDSGKKDSLTSSVRQSIKNIFTGKK